MKRWPLTIILAGSLAGCGGASSTPPASVASSAAENTSAQTAATEQEKVAAKPMPAAPAMPARTYEELLKDADEQLQAKNPKLSVQLLTEAIKQDPKRSDAFVKRAAILAEAKLLNEAIADISKALAIDSQNPRLLNTRGYFLLVTQQHDRAIQDFGDAIGLDLNYPQPYNNRGLCYIAQGEFEEAVKDFDNALRAKSDYVDAFNNRGFALMQLNQDESALESFSKAIELNPKHINAVANRGRCYLKLQRGAEAVQDFTAAIEIQPESAAYHSARAEAWRLQGNAEKASEDTQFVEWLTAMDDVNKKVARNVRDADSWAERGRLLLKQNRTEDAERSLKNAIALQPKNAVALTGLALMKMQQKKFDEAVTACTTALEAERRFETYSLRGDAYLALEKFDEAIADYESARRFDRQVVDTYRQRAELRKKNGDEKNAQADLDFAAGLEKQLTDTEIVKQNKAAPRAMVIEQVKHEEVAKEKVSAAELPVSAEK